MQPGDLVGVEGPRGPELGLIESVSGSRARLRVGFEARPLQLPLRQVELIGALPAAEVVPVRLEQPPWRLSAERLEQVSPSRRDLAAAWLLLVDGGPSEPLPLADLVELLQGEATPAACAATWLSLRRGEQLLFRWRQGRLEPRSVADLRSLRRERHRRALEERQQQQWLSLLRERRPIDTALLGPSQRRQLDLLLAWAGGDTATALPPELRQGLQQAHGAADSGAIRRLLVDLGQWEAHGLPSFRRSVWEEGFGADLLAEADRLLGEAELEQPGDADRRDLTGLRTYTLDDADTEEIDDALSLERLAEGRSRLWVHIADPGRLVPPGSPLDREARRRATSLYLAEAIVPMFPLPLAVGPFSLRQGRRCAAWSLAVELADDGAVAAYELLRSWVRPTYRLTYADGDALIDLAPREETDLAILHGLLEQRRRWRLARGALQLEQPEGRIRRRGEQAELEITDPSPARSMVAEAMILAGAVVAEHGQQHGLALPYRGQPASELPGEAELAALPAGPVRHAALRRGLSRGHTGVSPTSHFSLGLQAYVQATSPIRRYGDLMVQRQLAALLEGRDPLDGPALGEILTSLDPVLRESQQISREDQRHWQQVWFEQHRGQRWHGLFLRWLRPQDRLGLVHLETLAMDLAARCPEGAEPGDALSVHVQEVDSLCDLLRLEAR